MDRIEYGHLSQGGEEIHGAPASIIIPASCHLPPARFVLHSPSSPSPLHFRMALVILGSGV